MNKNLCPLILGLFVEKIKKSAKNIFFDIPGHFPTFVGEVSHMSFEIYGVKLTLCSHMQLDEKEFVAKLFLGSEPRSYFAQPPKTKKFSEKSYRQNDPYLFKVIYHQDLFKENWMEKQLPLHKPYIKDIVRAVRRIQDLFFQAERKAFKKIEKAKK